MRANGARPKQDIEELWKRIVFSMAISNTDDHFRNHGFVLSEEGWILSPLYDVNPDIYGEYLSLNVDADNSSIDFELALKAAPYYGMEKRNALEVVNSTKNVINSNWRKLAKKQNISRGEIERMVPAFRECER